MKKNLPGIFIGILLGLFIAWLAGMFNPFPPLPAPAPAAKVAEAAKPAAPVAVQAPAPPAAVAAPVAARAKVAATSPEGMAVNAAAAQAAFDKVRQQSRIKAMTNNLRQLSTAAQQYMLDKGVTSAGYYDLVGNGTDNYIRNVSSVMGEDYTGIYINQSDTQIMVVTPDGTTVTYDQ